MLCITRISYHIELSFILKNIIVSTMNTFVPLSPLEEITEIVNKMDTAAPLPALQRVGKLLRENPTIVNQSCEVIERVFMSVYSLEKTSSK